jgi:hypothetical protein
LVGALSIYLGYSLFRHIPSTAKGAGLGEGKIELPGGVSIFLTRIGPGVFFALFGIAVIGYSVTRPVNLDVPLAPNTVASTTAASTPALHYSGMTEADPVRNSALSAAVTGLPPDDVVARLNGLYQNSQRQMNTVEAEALARLIRAAKFYVILGNWQPQWGDRAVFERWVREHGNEDPPPNLVPAATGGIDTNLDMVSSRMAAASAARSATATASAA